jgi:O-antigen ligase
LLATQGVHRWVNPVLGASFALLVIGFTLSSRLPELTAPQSVRSFAALALGAYIFELRIPERAWRALRLTLPWMAVVNLSIGLVFHLVTERTVYRIDWGAFRLQGAVVPGHLAYLALAALLFSMLLASQRTVGTLLVIVNFAVIVWTGSRSAMLEGILLIAAWLTAEMLGARRQQLKLWTRWRFGAAIAVPLFLLSYSPFMAARLSSFHSHRAEGIEIRLPSVQGSKEEASETAKAAEEGRPTKAGEKRAPGRSDERSRPKDTSEEDEKAGVSIYGTETPESDSKTLRISTTGRVRAWKFFWGVAEENLWFGRGLGAGVIASRGHLPEAFLVPHNEYLRLVVDAGLVGLAIFVLGYLLQGVEILRRLAGTPERILTAAVLVTLALDGVLRNPLAAQHFMVPFWLFLASQLVATKQVSNSGG